VRTRVWGAIGGVSIASGHCSSTSVLLPMNDAQDLAQHFSTSDSIFDRFWWCPKDTTRGPCLLTRRKIWSMNAVLRHFAVSNIKPKFEKMD
jgi:hypothetical protein